MTPTLPNPPNPPDPSTSARRNPHDAADSRLDSGFGASQLGDLSTVPMQSPRRATGAFDLCHVGLVLRAVLFVEASLALGVLFAAPDLASAALQTALASGVALPGLLLWLALACGLQRRLDRLGPRAQWLAGALLGAACGGLGWVLMRWAGSGLITIGPGSAALLAGAFLGSLLMVWLQLRSRSQLPADTAARLAELQSRIRPHFLFNTLNSALGLVRRDPARAESLLEDLSELFRAALADGATAVSLGQEIELARRYLAIEQTRFGERLRIEWQLDPAAAAARVPPLLLQPLVENAVRHGVEPNPQGGLIRIRTRVRRGQAWLSIINALPAPRVEDAASGHGMALQNVRERLSLMHDVASSFEIRSEAGQFRVQIGLPLPAA